MSVSFYIAARSAQPDGGIYRFELYLNGVPRQIGFAPLANVTYLACSPNRNYLYATCTVDGDTGGCAAFEIAPDGGLTFLNSMSAEGLSTCHITTDATGRFLYCANYRSATVAEFSLAPDGSIAARKQIIRHTGKGVNPERQEAPHPHFTGLTPDKQFLCVIDLGIDAIKLYRLDPQRGIIDHENPYCFRVEPAGSGPRHLVFNRAGNRAFLLNELGNSVVSLTYADGKFGFVQSATSVPPFLQCPTKAAAIRLSEDERFLFASNRGFDSIACYRVEQNTGEMALCDMTLSGGSSPRDINFLPGMNKFAAANEFSDIVVLFDYCGKSGRLTPSGQYIRVPQPLAVWW